MRCIQRQEPIHLKGMGSVEVCDVEVVRRATVPGPAAAPPGHREREEVRHCEEAVGQNGGTQNPLTSSRRGTAVCPILEEGGSNSSGGPPVAQALAGRISNTRLVFENEVLERQFLTEMCISHQYGMTSGLLSHACAALWQMQTVLWPDHADYFRAHGVEEWQQSIDTLNWLLGAHAIFATMTSATLIWYMWWLRPRYEAAASLSGSVEVGRSKSSACMSQCRSPCISVDEFRWCTIIFVIMKFIFLVVSVWAFSLWPSRGGVLIVFAGELISNFGMSTCNFGVSFAGNLVLVICGLVVSLASLFIHRLDDERFPLFSIVYIAGMCMASLVVSRNLCQSERTVWLNVRGGELELERLHRILLDLLPKPVVRNLINLHEILPPTCCDVVVLQLDLCGFSAIAMQMDGEGLASWVHELFSEIDFAVMGRGLTKIGKFFCLCFSEACQALNAVSCWLAVDEVFVWLRARLCFC